MSKSKGKGKATTVETKPIKETPIKPSKPVVSHRTLYPIEVDAPIASTSKFTLDHMEQNLSPDAVLSANIDITTNTNITTNINTNINTNTNTTTNTSLITTTNTTTDIPTNTTTNTNTSLITTTNTNTNTNPNTNTSLIRTSKKMLVTTRSSSDSLW
jgi:hypothetical protein